MTAEQEKQPETLEEITDKLAVTLELNSEEEWNLSARELMSRIRSAEKLHIDITALVKEYYVTVQSVVQAMHEIHKKIPTFKIVPNLQDKEVQPDDAKR
jgi:hypothetical protein